MFRSDHIHASVSAKSERDERVFGAAASQDAEIEKPGSITQNTGTQTAIYQAVLRFVKQVINKQEISVINGHLSDELTENRKIPQSKFRLYSCDRIRYHLISNHNFMNIYISIICHVAFIFHMRIILV